MLLGPFVSVVLWRVGGFSSWPDWLVFNQSDKRMKLIRAMPQVDYLPLLMFVCRFAPARLGSVLDCATDDDESPARTEHTSGETLISLLCVASFEEWPPLALQFDC